MKILLLMLLTVLLSGCSTQRKISQKAYICYEIFPCGELMVHNFVNLSLTEGTQYRFNSVKCSPGDTILIKQYKSKVLGIFNKNFTVFIQYKDSLKNN